MRFFGIVRLEYDETLSDYKDIVILPEDIGEKIDEMKKTGKRAVKISDKPLMILRRGINDEIFVLYYPKALKIGVVSDFQIIKEFDYLFEALSERKHTQSELLDLAVEKTDAKTIKEIERLGKTIYDTIYLMSKLGLVEVEIDGIILTEYGREAYREFKKRIAAERRRALELKEKQKKEERERRQREWRRKIAESEEQVQNQVQNQVSDQENTGG